MKTRNDLRTKQSRVAIFTISSNNYMPYTKTLIESSLNSHPNADHYLCLADRVLPIEGYYPNNIVVVPTSDLGIPDFNGFSFRYDIMEFNTAAKPYMFLLLFSRGYENVIYFDPDIKVYRPIDSVFNALEAGATAVFTPHLTKPAETDASPNDITIMKAGIYNLGFAAFRRHDRVEELLRWWARRLRYQCVNAQEEGIFVDQKFMDLAPGFLPDVAILHDTSLNVAYWNLFQRDLDRTPDGWTVDGHPLTFFHFSGFDPRNSTRLSKHTSLFSRDNTTALDELLEDYRADLFDRGLNETPRANYAYERFTSGAKIPTFVRHLFREEFLTWEGNAFDNFEDYLEQGAVGTAPGPDGSICTNLMYAFWKDAPYLRGASDVRTPDGTAALSEWFIRHGQTSGVDPRLLATSVDRLSAFRRRRTRKAPAHDSRRAVDVSVVGYLTTDSGVGEAGRLTLRSLANGGRPVEGLDVSLNVASSRNNDSCRAWLADDARGRIQIFNVNADQLRLVQGHLRERTRSDAYRIAVPFWELSDFPAQWADAFDDVDEIWAPTRFIQAALVSRVAKPVIRMPIALEFDPSDGFARSDFGLPDGRFIFLFSFDFLSFSGRKNPLAVLAAFNLAFRGGKFERDVSLVIKCVNSAHAGGGMEKLLAEIDGRLDVRFIDRDLSRREMLGLVKASDCVVSLHRSEGLGLLVAEAIALGVPVIATDYSATTELISPSTGYPVDYKLIPLDPDDYPFARGQVWADPDLSHAAWQMRFVLEQGANTAAVVERAKRHLTEEFGIDTVNRLQEERFRELGL